MTTATTPLNGTIHIGTDDLPFVDLGDGTSLQLQSVDLAAGIWVVRTRFAPGTVLVTHRHTGPVHAVTLAGTWWYRESPEQRNTAGSFLFEPAGSVHTLTVPEDGEPADVWFHVVGANLELDHNGRVSAVVDAAAVLKVYRSLCAESRGDDRNVIVRR